MRKNVSISIEYYCMCIVVCIISLQMNSMEPYQL